MGNRRSMHRAGYKQPGRSKGQRSGMDIKKYEVFVKAAEFGSLTKAGEAMGYTQSGVSHMMHSLESEVGFPLFNRTSKGVGLSDAGQKLLPIVRNLLVWSEQLDQTISEINGVASGNICIGTFSSVSIHWLPRIIKSFQSDYPKIKISMKEGGIQEIDGWLAEGVADMGFYSRQPHHTFDWIELKQDPLLAILPKDYPIADGERFPVLAFNSRPFIMSAVGFDYDIHRVLEENGVSADIKFTSMDDYAIVSMVENKLGLSILPELVLKWCRQYVKVVELEPRAYRAVGIAVPSIKGASPAVKKFLAYSRHVLIRDSLL